MPHPTQGGDATEGRYQWAIEGAELVISEVEDSCRDRAHLHAVGVGEHAFDRAPMTLPLCFLNGRISVRRPT